MEKQSTNKPCFGIGETSHRLFIDQESHETKKEFLMRKELHHAMENLEDGYLSYQLHSEDIEAANGGMEPVWSLIDAQDIHQNMDVLYFDFSVHIKHNMAALTSLLEWSEEVYIKKFIKGLKKGSSADAEFDPKTKPTNETFKIKMDLFPSIFMVQSGGKMKRVEAIIFGGKHPNLVKFQYDLYERDCMVIDFKKEKFVPFWINNCNDKKEELYLLHLMGRLKKSCLFVTSLSLILKVSSLLDLSLLVRTLNLILILSNQFLLTSGSSRMAENEEGEDLIRSSPSNVSWTIL